MGREMPMKVQPIDASRPAEKMLVKEYRERRAVAFQAGLMNYDFQPRFTFEAEEYERGVEQDKRVREEIKTGQR